MTIQPLNFSLNDFLGIRPPPSLKNIYKELVTDIVGFERDEKLGGCLQKWTKEGVFLLNTFLTVE